MTFRVRFGAAALAAALVFGAASAEAATITYTLTGTGTGSLNGTAFTDAAFTFTLVGDTGNETVDPFNDVALIDPLDSATFDIAGAGSGTFSLATTLGLNSSNNVVFFGRSGMGFAPDLVDFTVTPPSDFFASFGAISGSDVSNSNDFQGVATTAGALSFDVVGNETLQASVGGQGPVGGVPEPATWAMMILGMGGLGALLRRRRTQGALA